MNLKEVVLREINKDKYHMVSLMWNLKKKSQFNKNREYKGGAGATFFCFFIN